MHGKLSTLRWRKAVLGGAERERPGRQCFFGAAKHRFWKLWREDEMNIGYEVMARFAKCCGDDENALRNYFQLDISLNSLYMQWKKADENFAKALTLSGSLLEGVRMVAQDPTESIFSFICSSNNNIKRISRMVERLCELYGESLTNIVLPDQKTVYDFADISRMAADEDMESKLRASGFGYRAAYLHQTAKKLAELGGESWVEELANKSYDEAKEGLQSLPGIGPKVADCICLTSLGKPAVVPVDTHVFQITAALYMPQLNEHKSLNKATYNQIGMLSWT
ncbi:unnamed protein product [Toxocara canis]|uniref:DNA-(apurinic or apyrimidinic site) lyase n=1 Tax=Toxocara canis TaxID=6265 RepID=A0A3P7IN57_TOXCA|nr:unnamed protein product [Toxocara canis]